MKCMALWGEPGAMIDGCIHLLLMTLHAIIITDKYNSYIIRSQCIQATVRLHEQVNGILETCTNMS